MENDINIRGKVSQQELQEMQEGLDWLKSWLKDREKNGAFKDDNTVYQQAMKSINEMKLYIDDDVGKRFIEAVENGELHFKNKALKALGYPQITKEEAINAGIKKIEKLLAQKDDKNLAYNPAAFIEEPVLFINRKNYEKEKNSEKCPSLGSIVVHEATHAALLKNSEKIVGDIILSEDIKVLGDRDSYFNSHNEAYARIMQFRYDNKFAASHQFSTEEIAQLRAACQEKRELYQKTPDDKPAGLDFHLFERYSDEQIKKMLNDTALIEKIEIEAKRDIALFDSKVKLGKSKKAIKEEVKEDKKTISVTDVTLGYLPNKGREIS